MAVSVHGATPFTSGNSYTTSVDATVRMQLWPHATSPATPHEIEDLSVNRRCPASPSYRRTATTAIPLKADRIATQTDTDRGLRSIHQNRGDRGVYNEGIEICDGTEKVSVGDWPGGLG